MAQEAVLRFQDQRFQDTLKTKFAIFSCLNGLLEGAIATNELKCLPVVGFYCRECIDAGTIEVCVLKWFMLRLEIINLVPCVCHYKKIFSCFEKIELSILLSKHGFEGGEAITLD